MYILANLSIYAAAIIEKDPQCCKGQRWRLKARNKQKLQEDKKEKERVEVLRKEMIEEKKRKKMKRGGVTLDAKSCYMVTAQANGDVVQWQKLREALRSGGAPNTSPEDLKQQELTASKNTWEVKNVRGEKLQTCIDITKILWAVSYMLKQTRYCVQLQLGKKINVKNHKKNEQMYKCWSNWSNMRKQRWNKNQKHLLMKLKRKEC